MPHRKLVKRYHEPGDFHELTFSCFLRKPLLTNHEWLQRLSRAIDAAGDAEQVELIAFVFMPTHVHLLVNPGRHDAELGRYLARIKQPSSKQIKESLRGCNSPLLHTLTIQERPGKECFRFWQEGGGFDRNVFKARSIMAAIDYLHLNPVRKNLCESAVDWQWSSARYYFLEPYRQQFPELPHVHGLPAGAVDPS